MTLAVTTQTPSDLSPVRISVLDGVRGLSIVLVLAAHLLPLNAIWAKLNESVGVLGMALFFVLSGYLIGGQVIKRVPPTQFLVRRLARIVPLAWLCAIVVAVIWQIEAATLLSHLLFYANLPPQTLHPPLDHYWSLCVELQFYALATLLLCLRPTLALKVVPLLLLAMTAYRISSGAGAGSLTWYRIDDILAGFTLAIAMSPAYRMRATRLLSRPTMLWGAATLLCLACTLRAEGNPFNFLRPYAAAAWVGTLLCQPKASPARLLSRPGWAYLATVSYAVYVLHVPLSATWLGTGDTLEKYLKRPLLLAVVFALAHLSTWHFEQRFNQWGRRFGTADH